MTQALDIAKQILLIPSDLEEKQLQNVLTKMLGSQLDAADL